MVIQWPYSRNLLRFCEFKGISKNIFWIQFVKYYAVKITNISSESRIAHSQIFLLATNSHYTVLFVIYLTNFNAACFIRFLKFSPSDFSFPFSSICNRTQFIVKFYCLQTYHTHTHFEGLIFSTFLSLKVVRTLSVIFVIPTLIHLATISKNDGIHKTVH